MAPVASSTVNARLARWAALHAGLLLACTAAALAWSALWPVVIAGTISFGGFVGAFRQHWTPAGTFGAANTLTACRLGGLLALALWPMSALWIAGGAAALLLLDGADGWLARRFDQASDFGAFFDKEVDAFALLVLCLLAVQHQGIAPLLVTAGLLRYVFAVLMHLGNPPARTEPRTNAARYLYVFMMGAVLLPFLPLPAWTQVVLWTAVAGLVASFFPYFAWALRLPQRLAGLRRALS
ncbi:CDP-alcohol phosphatidyltransferase [Longimonas halophila]|uniref:CDP-alcohol phosphatidyltransferase n=1 Tax=Longimonas halophila TaxID=1469170 RepID=A0A2H3NPR3_9BACT|nr:CDP-alcohol phosphatidyltransferase family protein [Longimonas halophila]PEN07109.1 CDP-alcohol phosphatidyltransferase [Longimonas halophila]